ncbi:MAG TPA: CsgG/HfaB family protein, partial [Leptospiraceae bacterium]|nr:CsgG/HfaB family protein [Leptospiraceae bacterium]
MERLPQKPSRRRAAPREPGDFYLRQAFFCAWIAFGLLGACKSTYPGGIPASADPASALTACSTSGLETTGVKRVAVFVFDPGGKEEALRMKVLDAYAAGFLRDKRFRPVEREKLGTILREQGLSSAGLLTGEDAAKMGGVLPVDWIVSATVMRSS